MDDVFNSDLAKEDGAPSATLPEAPVDAREAQTVDASAQAGEGAPTAPNTNGYVPLAALEATRAERKDWKEKALKGEGELKALKEALDRYQRGEYQPQGNGQAAVPQDPMQAMNSRVETIALNFSEKLTRKEYGTENVDKAFERFKDLQTKMPGLYQTVMSDPDPWGRMYTEVQKISAMEEIGTDPKAYREKLRAELMAELQPNQATAAPAVSLPQSLANARSSATRSSSTFTGPVPLANLFPN